MLCCECEGFVFRCEYCLRLDCAEPKCYDCAFEGETINHEVYQVESIKRTSASSG